MKKLVNQVINEIYRQMTITLTLRLDVPVRPMEAKGLIGGPSSGGDPLGPGDKGRTGDPTDSSKQQHFAACKTKILLFEREGPKLSHGMGKPSKLGSQSPSQGKSQTETERGGICRSSQECLTGIIDPGQRPLPTKPLSWKRPESTSPPDISKSECRGCEAWLIPEP